MFAGQSCATGAQPAGRTDNAPAREASPEPDPEAAELATFIIDGECPKCGKVITRGHKKHLAVCTGKPAYDPTLAELIELEVGKMERQEQKLAELEVGGLIELDEDKVVFMVVGSTGADVQLASPPLPAAPALATAACRCHCHCCNRLHAAKRLTTLGTPQCRHESCTRVYAAKCLTMSDTRMRESASAPSALTSPAQHISIISDVPDSASMHRLSENTLAMHCRHSRREYTWCAGKHYKVEFSDEKRKCACVDHRIRKHDCKHIRLMLQTLGVQDNPSDWYAAAKRLVQSQATNVQDVQQAKAPKSGRKPTRAQAAAQAFL